MNLTTNSLRSLLSLSEKRDALTAELIRVEAQISSAMKGRNVSAKVADIVTSQPAAKRGRRSGRRGALKDLILDLLQEAGEAGLAVKDVAARLGLNPANVHVWFSTTGKKLKEVEKAGRGMYRLNGKSAPAESENSSEPVEAPAKRAKTRKVTKKTVRAPRKAKAKK